MRVQYFFVGLLALLLLSWGCSKDDEPTTPTPTPGFTSSFPNNSVTINPGGISSAKLTNGTPPYTITTPPNASVATAVISNDSVHITAVGAGTTSLTISDASPSPGDDPLVRTLTINITVPGGATITVNGSVRDAEGQPVGGAAVIIPGRPAVTSASDGSFSIAGVTTPYDITFIVSTSNLANTYRGLTRPDPTLHFLFYVFSTPNTASISGAVPVVAGRTTRVLYVSGERSWYTTASGGTYALSVSWYGSTTTLAGKIYVIRWVTATGIPTSYDAYGDRDQTVSAGGTFTGINFTAGQLTDPAEMNISGAVTRPSASYNLTQRTLFIGFGSSITYVAGESGTLGDNLSYTVPSIAGATFGIDAYASFGGRTTEYLKSGIAAGAQSVSIPLEEAPQLTLPVNGGTGVDTTTSFLFSQGGGTGVNFAQVSGTSTDPTFLTLTASNSFNIPNLAQQGLGLPANRSYSWRVLKLFPFASMNEAASPLFLSRLEGSAGDLGLGISEMFTFTTSP